MSNLFKVVPVKELRIKNYVSNSSIIHKYDHTSMAIIPADQGSTPKSKRMQLMADSMATKLGAPGYYPFCLKAAWHLSERFLNNLVELSLTKRRPIAYFIAMVKAEFESQAYERANR